MSGSSPRLPPSARAGSSAKGPGAVRFWGKGPQVGAAVAECERFRREITGDNPAQDGAAQQETSSREPAAGRVGEGCRSLTSLQPAGQPQGVGQRPHTWCLLPTHCPSPFRMHSLTPELWMGWREKPSSKVSSVSEGGTQSSPQEASRQAVSGPLFTVLICSKIRMTRRPPGSKTDEAG